MKLKRLIVHGFKSFKDRTVIHFDNGITGIVGPNGCGKSNIVDALFWVMGEQSAKHLRGTSMKDVIFSGSSKYSPGSWAEVSLVLENNTGKHIHIGETVVDPAEIQITRKLYRNGESDYRINNIPCRLKDIQEVFMDTGAGAKSYSIIAQGEIERLVRAKPEERQRIIEEVAGITKFKARKKDSLRKITQTEVNLARLQDLQSEIEKQIGTLRDQAAKAEKAVVLREKIEKNDLLVSSHKVYDTLIGYREVKQKLNSFNLDVNSWNITKQELEISLETERLKRDEITASLEEMQTAYNTVSKELATCEERISSISRSKKDKESLVTTRLREKEELISELANRKERLVQLEQEYDSLIRFSNEDHDFSDLEERVELLKGSLEDKGSTLSDIDGELKSRKSELQKIEQKSFNFRARIDELSGNLEDISKEIEDLENRYSGVSSEIGNDRENLVRAEKIAKELENKERDTKETIAKLSSSYEEIDIKAKESRKNYITTESRLSSLEDLTKSLEGVKEGAKEFLQTTSAEDFELLGNLIECDDKYTQAVQASLSDLMDLLVPATDAEKFVTWLQENKKHSADVLIGLSNESVQQDESIRRIELNGFTDVTSLAQMATVSKHAYTDIVKKILHGIYIVSDLDEKSAKRIPSDLQYRALVSIDGRFVVRKFETGTILSSFSNDNSMEKSGRIARNNQISNLKNEVADKKDLAEKTEKILTEIKIELSATQELYDRLRTDLAEAKANFAAKDSTLKSKLENFENGTSRLDILKNRKDVLSKQRLESLEQEEILDKEKQTLEEITSDLEERSLSLSDEISDLKANYDSEKEELLEKVVALKSMQERIKSTSNQLDDIKNQCNRVEGKINTNSTLVLEYTDEIGTLSMELEYLLESNLEIVSQLKNKEGKLSNTKETLQQLLLNMQEREDQVKKLSRDISSIEKNIVESEIKLGQFLTEEEQTVKNIFEKYQVDLRKIVGDYIEYTDDDYKELNDIASMYFKETEFGQEKIKQNNYEFIKVYPNELKKSQESLKRYKGEFAALGDINWQAIEEYRRQKLRFEFLKEQEIELKKSLDDLRAAIDQIDRKSKERFDMAFHEVNARFEKVFPIIFGGGTAKLELVEVKEGDEVELGVDIIARPPGKKMQNINLMSGGEKAMTAVSLIFSIFLVKPSPFCLLDEVDAPLDDANVGRFIELLKEMSNDSQFILITHNKKTMELNDTLYGVTMQEPGVSKTVSVQLH